jgi:zinc-ribbon domain
MQQIFCPTCGTSLAPTAKFCGICGNSVEAEAPLPKTSGTEPVTAKEVSNTQPVNEPGAQAAPTPTMNLKPTSTEKLDPASPEAIAAMKRYKSAYQIARLTDIAGHVLKAAGVLMAIGALITFGFGGFAVLMALFLAGVFFFLFLALGLVVSTQAQSLRAGLDSAVNSSPFLTDEQRAKVMSL